MCQKRQLDEESWQTTAAAAANTDHGDDHNNSTTTTTWKSCHLIKQQTDELRRVGKSHKNSIIIIVIIVGRREIGSFSRADDPSSPTVRTERWKGACVWATELLINPVSTCFTFTLRLLLLLLFLLFLVWLVVVFVGAQLFRTRSCDPLDSQCPN
jgi:hypothetical protein